MIRFVKQMIAAPIDWVLGWRLQKFRYSLTTDIRENDVVVAGFPKSGNTWMQNLIAGVIYGIDTRFLPDRLTQELVPDLHNKFFFKRFGEFSIFKSHELPNPKYRRVIHLVRDGRDAMASYFAMNKALGLEVTLRDMVVEGKEVYPAKWHVHTKQWMENPHDADLLSLRYEDLIENPVAELIRVCEFLGIERDIELIERVVDGNRFEMMKQKESRYGWDNSGWNPEESFVRKGQIGSHKSEIPNDLLRIFEAESRNELMTFNYELSE